MIAVETNPEKSSRQMPMLSIIVPHYNRPKMLLELIDTIPDLEEVEVIVVDDHSTLPFPSMDDFSRPVRIIPQSPTKKGAGFARNSGLNAATGTWVIFADSDDMFVPGALEALLGVIRSAQVDLIYLRPTSFADNGETGSRHLPTLDLYTRAEAGEPECLVQFYAPWCKCIRRSLIEQHDLRFDTTMVSEDVMFSAGLFFAADHTLISDILTYRIRQGHDSLTSTVSASTIKQATSVIMRYNALLCKNNMRDYQVPVMAQLRKIAFKNPFTVINFIFAAKALKQPVFVTKKHVQKIWNSLVRRI